MVQTIQDHNNNNNDNDNKKPFTLGNLAQLQSDLASERNNKGGAWYYVELKDSHKVLHLAKATADKLARAGLKGVKTYYSSKTAPLTFNNLLKVFKENPQEFTNRGSMAAKEEQ